MRDRTPLLFLVAVLAATPAYANADIPVGKVMARAVGNITGASDHQAAVLRVVRMKYAGPEDAWWQAQLVITAPGGVTVWKSPVKDDGPFNFQGGPGGATDLEVAGPLERAGQGEVVLQEMQSDVRVPHFRILRWSGGNLVFVRSSGLLEIPPKSGKFGWNSDPTPRGRWIGKFKHILGPGRAEVELGSMQDSTAQTAVVTATATGFRLSSK